MSRIAFFSIPAWGHTNPTVEVVRQLTERGHRVRYYTFLPFREKLEKAGAEVILCDGYLPPEPKNLARKVGRDFSALVNMAMEMTLRMDSTVGPELESWGPDAVVSDSVCFWGKLIAWKLRAPYICSTTTFAFNAHSAGQIRRGPGELLYTLLGLPGISRDVRRLREHGYPVQDLPELFQNGNDTDTIVYTSRSFQPMAETFSDRVLFVGPSVPVCERDRTPRERPLVYVSLGTVMNRDPAFFRACVQAFSDGKRDVILSVGEGMELSRLGTLPPRVKAYSRVDQLQVLCRADVFLTHCGMNSANESIACGVPAVLYPRQSEEGLVAARMAELGMGVPLRSRKPAEIRAAVEQVLADDTYRRRTEEMAAEFRRCGGAEAAANRIAAIAAGKGADGVSAEISR